MTPAPEARGRERELALVSVLWGLSILSLIAASMMSMGSISAAIQRNTEKRVEADSILESGITLAILGLLDARPDKRWRVDGVPRAVSFAGSSMSISIQDVYGLIDLNEADIIVLRGLFQGAGLAPDEASRFAARIVDWRTAGDLHSLDGASKDDYRAASLPYAPRGGPFQSVDELNLVLGMTPELYARVAPALTVYSHQPGVDSRLAPRAALLALPGMDTGQVDNILTERMSSPGTVNNQGITLPAGVVDPTLSMNGRAFAIRTELNNGRTPITKEAVIRLTGNPAHPYLAHYAK